MNYLIGHQIEQYRLEAVLGDGGMGIVYRAYDLKGDRLVAVKMMSANLAQKPEFQRRFAQEARVTHNFNSPNIVKVYRFGDYQGVPYLAMEYIPGGSLTDYLRQLQWAGRRIALDEAIALTAQVAEGLSYAHQRGLIHRDIKPDNILLRQPGGSGRPKQAVITDFGLAILLKEGEEVSTNPFMGSLPYLSPEQCSNLPLDGRSDLYSLGVMLYQLTTGQLPFRIEAPADVIKHLQEIPLPPRLVNPHLPHVIEDIVLKALAKKPDDRFQAGAELAHKLRSIDLQAEGKAQTAVSSGSAVTQWLESRWIAGVNVRNRIDVNRTWTSPGDYRLFIAHQWEEPRVEALSGGIVTIGRHPDNTIVLKDRSVSAHHARLENTDTGWRVVDLGSTNGTSLDERKLEYNQPADWASYQTLRIGQYALQWQAFTSHAPGNGAATPLIATALLATSAHPATPSPTTNGHSKPQAASMAVLSAAAGTPDAAAGLALVAHQSSDWDDSDLVMAQSGHTLELTLHPATLEIAPGAISQIQLRVLNLSATVEDISLFALEQGQTPHWISWRVSQIKLLPGESDTLTVDVAPPKDSAVLAGSHAIELHAVTSRGITETVSVVVHVARWERFSLDMHPRNLQEKINCRLTIDDRGNFANVYRLEGSDDEDRLIFNFALPQNATLVDYGSNQQQLGIQPGNTSVQMFTIQPKKRPWFRAPSEPFPFRIRIHTETSDWQTLDGQVSILPRFSLRFLFFVLLLLLLMLLLGFAIVSRVRANATAREIAMLGSAAATATAYVATLSELESELNSSRLTADALRAAGDEAGAAALEATVAALQTTIAAQGTEGAQLPTTPTAVPVPVDITLDNLSVPEDAPIGTTVGTFTAVLNTGATAGIPRTPSPPSQNEARPNIQARLLQQVGPRIIYSLVPGTGDADNAFFFIDGAALKTAGRFDAAMQSSYSVRVRADNGAGGIFERPFTISVVALNNTPTLSVADVTVDEGAGRAIIAITMTDDSDSVVSVDVSTADGTARQGEDYVPFIGTVRWQPGETGRKSIEILIIDDAIHEPDETFTVHLSNPVIGVINTGTATVTIVDNDDPPSLSIADLTVSESAGQAVLVVTMAGLSSQAVSVNYATVDGAARANDDYTPTSGTLTWQAGETGAKSFPVIINADRINEPDEWFNVILTDVPTNNATLSAQNRAIVTIQDSDPPPQLQLRTTSVDEGSGQPQIEVRLFGGNYLDVEVSVAVSDGTAVSGRDYIFTPVPSLVFPANEVDHVLSFPIRILDDQIFEPGEGKTIEITLTPGQNSGVAPLSGLIRIIDNDAAPTLRIINNSLEVIEGTSDNNTVLVVAVMLERGIDRAVTAVVNTEDIEAVAGVDYVAISNLELDFPANAVNTVRAFPVQIIADAVDEADAKAFYVHITTPDDPDVGGTSGVITILDDDVAGIDVSPTILNVTEGDTNTVVTYDIRLTSVPTGSVTLAVNPEEQLRLQNAGPGEVITLTFAVDSALTPQSIRVFAVDDSLAEGPHIARITHTSNSEDPRYQGKTQVVRVNITDNDLPPLIDPGQSREVPADAEAGTFGDPITATVRSTAGSLQDWTISSVSPTSATGYFTIATIAQRGYGQLSLTQAGADADLSPGDRFTLALTVSDGFNVSAPENVTINVVAANGEGPLDTLRTVTEPDPPPPIFQNWIPVSPITASDYYAINPDAGQVGPAAVDVAKIDFATPPSMYQLQITTNLTYANAPPGSIDGAYNAAEDVALTMPVPGVPVNHYDTDVATATLTLTGINDALILGNISASRAYTERGSRLFLAPSAIVSGIDNPPNINGVLTAEITANGVAEDRLGITTLPTGYSFNVRQRQIQRNFPGPGFTVFAIYNQNRENAGPLSVIFNENATVDDIQAVIRAVYFSRTVNDADLLDPSTLPRSIRFSLRDVLAADSNQPIAVANGVAVRHREGLTVAQAPGGVAGKRFMVTLTRRHNDPNPS